MTRARHYWVMGFLFLTGCYGDCISIGYTSAHVTAEDALSHAVVSLAGAVVTEIPDGPPPHTNMLSDSFPASAAYTICCATGPLRLQVTVKGYLPVDTTVVIPYHGHCRLPELTAIVLQLRRASG
jgi:hypothetical protein